MVKVTGQKRQRQGMYWVRSTGNEVWLWIVTDPDESQSSALSPIWTGAYHDFGGETAEGSSGMSMHTFNHMIYEMAEKCVRHLVLGISAREHGLHSWLCWSFSPSQEGHLLPQGKPLNTFLSKHLFSLPRGLDTLIVPEALTSMFLPPPLPRN